MCIYCDYCVYHYKSTELVSLYTFDIGLEINIIINGILQNGQESGNNKPLWKYVKSQKQETFGISALKSNGNVITDSLSKTGIFYSQFPKIKPLHIS